MEINHGHSPEPASRQCPIRSRNGQVLWLHPARASPRLTTAFALRAFLQRKPWAQPAYQSAFALAHVTTERADRDRAECFAAGQLARRAAQLPRDQPSGLRPRVDRRSWPAYGFDAKE